MTTARSAPHGGPWWVSAVLTTGLIAAVTVPLTPVDVVQGEAQRFMYLHVPAAWCAYLCFFLVLVAGVHHLRTGSAHPSRSDRSDRLGRAAAQIGVVLTALTLLTGSVWGRLTWGTWWAWDARVTTTVAMGLVYVGYLALRGLVSGPAGRRAVALLGVIGFTIVPLVHFSVVWWRTLHQPATILAPSLSPPLDPRMGVALAVSVLAFSVLTVWALRWRMLALVTADAPAAPAAVPVPGSVRS